MDVEDPEALFRSEITAGRSPEEIVAMLISREVGPITAIMAMRAVMGMSVADGKRLVDACSPPEKLVANQALRGELAWLLHPDPNVTTTSSTRVQPESFENA